MVIKIQKESAEPIRFCTNCRQWDLNPYGVATNRFGVCLVCHSDTPAFKHSQQRLSYHRLKKLTRVFFWNLATIFLVFLHKMLYSRSV